MLANNSSSSSHNSMRGLQLFIADLRGSVHTEDREKRVQAELVNIRRQFGAGNDSERAKGGIPSRPSSSLSGYQRKKYVAKLAYILIATNTTRTADLMFGLDECCELMASTVYSEKYIAYMTLELLYYHPDVAQLAGDRIIQQLKLDLASSTDNSVCLALNFLAVVGKFNSVLTTELIHEVFQVLRSPTSAQILKKKSALAFLALLRNDSSILTQDARRKQLWIQRIMSLLDDTNDYRLMVSVLPLIEYIAHDVDGQACIKLIPQLSDILFNCVSGKGEASHELSSHENIPNPWLVTKIVSILNFLISSPSSAEGEITFSDIDQGTLGKLRSSVTKAIEIGTQSAVDAVARTVKNTILFSLINFASKLDPSTDAIISSVTALCSLLTSTETNTRYLTLDCLIKLCSVSGKSARDDVRAKHMEQLFSLLMMERDTSIVRKLVNLLCTFTDSTNVKPIVNALLRFMTDSRHSDHVIRTDIAVKIAILTEKFATDTTWYVVVSLQLLSISTFSLGSSNIWQRICQIVVNNKSLHKLTCQRLLEYLQQKNVSDAIVKAGAFILGEFAELLAPETSCGELFNLFTDKYFSVSNLCRAMILTTMMKLYNRDAQIGSAVIKFYQLELNSLDVELQTRSYEYLKIIQLEKISGLQLTASLFEPMPPFSSNKNPLLDRLGSSALSTSESTSDFSAANSTSTAPTPPPTRKNKNLSRNLKYDDQQLAASWQDGFRRMLKHKQGVFYVSHFVKILYRLTVAPAQPELLEVALTYINVSDQPITSLLTEIIPCKTGNNPPYITKVINVPHSSLSKGERTTHRTEILTRRASPLDQSPILNVSLKCGGHISSISLKVAAGISNTILTSQAANKPQVSLSQFVQRWKALSDALGKNGECHIKTRAVSMRSFEQVSGCIQKMGFDVIDQAMVGDTVFAAGIIHTKNDGNSGCLLKLRCQDKEVDITCKSTQGSQLSGLIVESVCEALI
ncbi:LAME_0F02916g1_1 [Lachancea meyersii CBS 8951]|uniref:AP-2 complex subunit alpha n=1 Tax=Lachancea meyersii CBS 8951 TaxID=1266667 RepID=A0A1G4JR90_9SACH|nr:LAME_0F02916g1_1 [Lachancea meyersii CBS 8951]